MELLVKLNSAKTSGEIYKVITSNEQELFDYFSLINHEELTNQKTSFQQLSLKSQLVAELNFKNPAVEAFVNLVLNTSIRLGDMFVFDRYYSILESKNLEVSSLIKASAFFMTGVRNIQDLQASYTAIVSALEEAYLEELDNNNDAISTIINYYALCVKHFAEFALIEVEVVRNNIFQSYSDTNVTCLSDEVVGEVCKVNLEWSNDPYSKIHSILDEFVGRSLIESTIQIEAFLIETEGKYREQFLKSAGTFNDIYNLSKGFYELINDSTVFNSLSRGVKVLDNEKQLFCYLFAYGKMHKAKLKDGINALPIINENHQLIDWGCGQGVGSVLYLEHLEKNAKLKLCEEVTLIEPSELAIKRASLHIQNKAKRIRTVKKGFDELIESDLKSAKVTVHILSNILDVELFSLTKLIDLIESKFIGTNYFIISSPYINTTRSARIDSFVHYFEQNSVYEEIKNIRQKKGDWTNGWSRIIHVFKTIINE